MARDSVWLQVVVVAHAMAVFSLQVADKVLPLTVGCHRRVIGRRAGSPGAGNWLLPLLLLLCRRLACCPLMSACHYLSFSFILTSSFLLISTMAKLKVCRIKIWNGAAKHPLHSRLAFVAAEATWEMKAGFGVWWRRQKENIFTLSHSRPNMKAVSGDGKTLFDLLNLLKHCWSLTSALPDWWPFLFLNRLHCKYSNTLQEFDFPSYFPVLWFKSILALFVSYSNCCHDWLTLM